MSKETLDFVTHIPAEKLQNFFGVFFQFHIGVDIGRVDSCHIREINRALAVSVGLMEEMPENLIMCLCPTCANNFYGTGSYYLRRINANSTEKDICTYCGQRRGFDYEVVQKLKDNEKK